MPTRQTARVSSRKQPKQARSADLVAAVLDAVVQVLTTEGARRFTTARVAERAGVSVGSLYQYFPNKAAILFRLQSDEWLRTATLLRGILEDGDTPPPARVRRLVHAFVRSECDEARIRIALHDAAPLYRDAPEAIEARAASARIFHDFLRDAAPHVAKETRSIAAQLIRTTLSACGSSFSETPRTPAEIDAYSEALSDMLCAYLDTLCAGGGEWRAQAPRADRGDAQP